MTEPKTNTKFSKAAIAAIISAIVAIIALSVAYKLAGNEDFRRIFDIISRICGVSILAAIIFGVIGLFMSVEIHREPRGRNYAITSIVLGLVLAIVGQRLLRFDATAKQSEAKQFLGAIYTAYQSYHSQYGAYPASPSIQVGNTTYNCFNIAGWVPKGQVRYTYDCAGTSTYYPGWDGTPWVMDCQWKSAAKATKDSFTIAACGNVDSDPTQDEWTIDDAKHLRNVVDDVWK